MKAVGRAEAPTFLSAAREGVSWDKKTLEKNIESRTRWCNGFKVVR